DDPRWRSSGVKRQKQNKATASRIEHAVITTTPVSIKVLSEKIGKSATEIIRTLFILGIQKTINESIDFETAELVTSELYGDTPITLEYKPIATFEEELKTRLNQQAEEDVDHLETRPPIVTIMGHVDHGKTSLLDRIRKANVQSGEAGGITQHIGAYTVSLKGRPITFLDTPGHEAFTAMRARGAQGADVAVLVVAADDGVMPQTLESISHAKLANAHMIVACNKIDRAGANPDRVKNQLVEHDVLIEEWGGKVPFVKVSAKTGEGIEDLLENILTLSDYEILPKANPARPAHGVILEAKLDKALGKTATVLVQNGTLSTGDFIVAGTCTGKVRIMKDDKGRVVKKAGPSTPVVVTGWDDIPEAGDVLDAVDDEKFAKGLADERKIIEDAKALAKSGGAKSIDDLFSGSDANGLKTISLVIKADVQGSLEALKQSLGDLGNDEVEVKIVHGGVGAINESDVSIADSAKAIVIGFNVRPDSIARASAAQKGVDIRFYDVIYNAIEEIENAVHGMLAPVYQENILGEAEVRELFKISGVGTIAGCHVTDGKILRGAKARLFRNGKAVITTEIASLRHEKDDVKEIAKNFDCGIMLLNYQDIKVGDVIEAYEMEQVNG
ncbi:MAG: translation initiation factor IF-2, partial [Clostridia bacterium]|nr:translation initiation factor IF-2 [Clostridia bacterium]